MFPVVYVLFYALAGGVGGLLTAAVIEMFMKRFSHKKTLLTGPISSGKTTFLQYISKDDITNGATGAPRTYKVKDAQFDEVTDLGGAEIWLNNFDARMKDYNYILFFFDVTKYVEDSDYRNVANARIDFIYKRKTDSQTMLMIGTHIDKAVGNFKADVEHLLAGKPYQNVLNRIVYVDTTRENCVKTILEGLRI